MCPIRRSAHGTSIGGTKLRDIDVPKCGAAASTPEEFEKMCTKKIAKIHTAVIGLELLGGDERVEAPSSITKILMA
jgi:hypothetical protein